MSWDRIKMAEQFLRQANAIHPEDAADQDEYNRQLALQDLYYECYKTCFSEHELRAALERSAKGNVKVPESANADLYKKWFARKASELLDQFG